jgi:hypothetical protein
MLSRGPARLLAGAGSGCPPVRSIVLAALNYLAQSRPALLFDESLGNPILEQALIRKTAGLPSSDMTGPQDSFSKPLVLREQDIEDAFIEKLRTLKYSYRPDIRDRAALEHNFRQKFEALNRVMLTDGEFQRLLDELITPDVFRCRASIECL